jgi:hypothetical protein
VKTTRRGLYQWMDRPRLLLTLLLGLALVACDDDTSGDAGPDTADTGTGLTFFLDTGWIDGMRMPVEGLAVEIYDGADLTTVVGTATSDAGGRAVAAVPPIEEFWVARASADGYRDSWYFHIEGVAADASWGNITAVSDELWATSYAAAAVTPDPAAGVIAVSGLAGATVTAEPGGTVVYGRLQRPVPVAQMTDDSREVFIMNAPAGDVEVTFENELESVSRTVRAFPDAFTAALL